MEQHRNEYEWYLERLDGAYSDEKAAFLEKDAASIAEANSTRRDLLEQYYSGEITEKQYEQKSARYKVLILVGVVLFLCVFSGIFRYCFYAAKYSLPCGDYPIQSIAAFGTSTKNISLLEGYMLITFLHCFGYVYFSIFILLFSVLMQKYALTALLGATITLIPYIGLSATVLCRLPIPTAFMNSINYISGSAYSGYTQTDEAAVTFREISNQELIANTK